MTSFLKNFKHSPSCSKKKNYKFGKTLGSAGTYGIVKEAVHSEYGRVAVKIIDKNSVKGHESMVYEEMEILKRLHHPHIVSFKEWFESSSKFYIVTQLATGGELFDRICEYGKFSEKDAVIIITEILDALSYIHDNQIVHRDLKPENLLYLTSDHDSPLVLADFGIARNVKEDQVLLTVAGSYGYAAPEILSGRGYGKLCDIWSLGVITYTLLCGYSPFRSRDKDELIKETVCANIVFHQKYWKNISQDAKDFIVSLLKINPSERPTAKEALKHKWITGSNAKNINLMPSVKTEIDARKQLRHAIESVRLENRIKALKMETDSDEFDAEERPTSEGSPVNSDTSGSTDRSSHHSAERSKKASANVFSEVVLAKLRAENKIPKGKK
ncbi:uncharacterized protein T551_01059 [Pneumocystis jirovecii RU7]|uniref:calcium/calmodulin-dependent protein kinase n=1 Tax=Pneumocystis jirovecii (strain RU7) TaxID=1408657 RepID=A0A0W4ZTV4_PNEJ7|nr:uncharacterized protein T551_01059 [Pneumocystis jirovecii RU7]KTW31798.1 hypothetical protein T551_01059 [Pneumocystis jirovecii RU7]